MLRVGGVSDRLGGTPGSSDVGVAPPTGAIVINELLAASSTGADAIEVLNTTDGPVDVGNYFVTDDPEQIDKFTIAAGTMVPANGYLVLDLANVPGLALSDTGGRVVIQAADDTGEYLGFQTDRGFDAADPDVTEGIYVNSVGNVDFVPLTSSTLGGPNSDPTIGPLVITELMYNPLPGETEWLELHNTSDSLLELGAERWSVAEAIDYTFPAGTALEPFEYALLIQGDDGADHATVVSDFRAANTVPADVNIFVYEPTLNGSLSNNGEDIAIGRSLGVDQPVIKTEFVEFDNAEPWPADTDGTGNSLARINTRVYGNEPTNWTTGGMGGSPGVANSSSPFDLDQDGSIGGGDIDVIHEAIRSGAFDPNLDLDGSGAIDTEDVAFWLDGAGNETIGTPYVYGDANLDGKVDALDLNSVGINWLTDTTNWRRGDFTGDGRVDSLDLNRLGINWQSGVAPLAAARSPRAPLAARAVSVDRVDAILASEDVSRRSSRSALEALTSTDATPTQVVEQANVVLRQRWTSEARRSLGNLDGNDEPATGADEFGDLADDVFAAW